MMIMAVGRSLPRFQMVGVLYPQSRRLQADLAEFLVTVVQFCHHVFKISKQPAIKRLASNLSDAYLKGVQSKLETFASSIKDEAMVLKAQRIEEEASSNKVFRLFSKNFYQSASDQHERAMQREILDLCSEFDYATPWKQALKAGYSKLFVSNKEYHDWKNGTKSCTLVYIGRLGAGKTVLMANMVASLPGQMQYPAAMLAYFFCRHDIAESLQARTIIGAFARQLLNANPQITSRKVFPKGASAHLHADDILVFLKNVFPSSTKIYFILDGLDDMNDEERQTLTLALRDLQDYFTLHVCVSIRTGPNTSQHLQSMKFANFEVTQIPENNPELDDYIEKELRSCVDSGRLQLGEAELFDRIQEVLVEKSQGMFLWTSLQIQYLCSMKTDDDIRHALMHLPKDLSETYLRILSQANQDCGQDFQTRILQLMTASLRPLTLRELQEALSVVQGDRTWNKARLPNDMYSTLACCGCVIIVDEEELTARFVHQSVKQFLLEYCEEGGAPRLTITKAHQEVLDIIITYLNYGEFDRQLSNYVIPNLDVGNVPLAIVRTLLGPSLVTNILSWIFHSRGPRSKVDIGRIIASRPTLNIHFHSYATAYWAEHLSKASPLSLEPQFCGMLKRLLVQRRIQLKRSQPLFPPVAPGQTQTIDRIIEPRIIETLPPADQQEALLLAARNQHFELTRHILQRCVRNPSLRHDDLPGKPTLLIRATQDGNMRLIKLFAQTGLRKAKDLDMVDSYGRTALDLATHMGNERASLFLRSLKPNSKNLGRFTNTSRAPFSSTSRRYFSSFDYGSESD